MFRLQAEGLLALCEGAIYGFHVSDCSRAEYRKYPKVAIAPSHYLLNFAERQVRRDAVYGALQERRSDLNPV